MPLFFTSTPAEGYNPYEFYLGPKAANPTVDNNGGALVEGQYYWNTALDIVRFYTGTVWADSNLTAVQKTGDIMTGQLTLPGGGTGNQAATVNQVVSKAGDTMTGPLVLSGNATAVLNPVPLQQVESLSFSFKNKLINAIGNINQRGHVSGSATTIANQYTLDRWRIVTLGQSVTWSDVDGVRTFTVPAGGFEQVIESVNIPGGTYVINWTGTATCTVNGSAAAKGSTFVSTGVDVTIRFSSGTLSLPQVELGTRPTVFEYRHFNIEFMMCKRYFEVAAFYGSNYGLTGSNIDNTIYFRVPKRATPVITFSNTSYASASGLSAPVVDSQRFLIRYTCTLTGMATALGDWTASAEL